MKIIFHLVAIIIVLLPSVATHARSLTPQLLQKLGNGTILVEDMQGNRVFSHRTNEHFVPASAIKIATSACALEALGSDFHFPTAIYQDGQGVLYVKGFGDPFLVSEEIAKLVSRLKEKGVRKVSKIVLDDSYFSPNMKLDGQSSSLNPYDARNSALLVNFNTINLKKMPSGQVVSAEPQTPITDLGKVFAKGLKVGKQRVNLSKYPDEALIYAGELLKEFMIRNGIKVGGQIVGGTVPVSLKPILVYQSSKSIEGNIKDLLEYSNNIIANQIFFFMGAYKHQAPATIEKGQLALNECLKTRFGWDNFTLVEGSGLSRQNRVTAEQLMVLVRYYDDHKELLPLKKKIFRAKTGTLTGVSTLAGFMTTPAGKTYRFVIMMKGPHATHGAKFAVGRELYRTLSQR
ncbi:MAG: D-alanyl-D-alanine carboxypeptidase [Deltaproteobacteria bacterium]|jgi:serine-type D-Ala-D-Ala carboxypeptidase/endopeptidase (penicillin-binding protein 4)|nr:D-alanyl-D-alanine carboxypeptidase [Deltaproteobacteria bacterium]